MLDRLAALAREAADDKRVADRLAAACDPTTILALVEVAKAAKRWDTATLAHENCAKVDGRMQLLDAAMEAADALRSALEKIAQPEPGP